MKSVFSVDRWRGLFQKTPPPLWYHAVKKISPEVAIWTWEDVKVDVAGAMRVAMGVWRSSRWLRCRYPEPLTLPKGAGYLRWLRLQIIFRFWRDPVALANLEAAFRRRPEETIIDHYLHDYRLRLKYPLALVSEGRLIFAKWLLNHGLPRFGGTAEDVMWFLNVAETDEDSFIKLSRAISPTWQADAAAAPERLQPMVRLLNERGRSDRGITVFGHYTFRSGLQRSAMLTIGALKSAGEEVSMRNIPILDGRDASLRGADYLGEEDHDLTLLHVTPDPFYLKTYERAGLHPRCQSRRIAHYAWELPAPPPDGEPIPDLREIWVYSRFVAESLRPWGLPTHVILPPMRRPAETSDEAVASMRTRLGLASDDFVFLYVFDVSSTLERKNPASVIEAFRRAVRPSDKARLVLKAARTLQFADRFAPIAQMAKEAGVIMLSEMLTDTEMNVLMAACDSYVSLHRAEGFGFTLAEAMLLGKPVIATGYSGNLDYMTDNNSYLTRWTPTEVPQGTLTYPEGFIWADPDIDHAASFMRQVLDHRNEAIEKGQRARSDAERWFDPNLIAQQITERLKVVRGLGS